MPDPLEDITTHPFRYGNFAGKPVRIQPFWSAWLFRDDHKAVLKQSLRQIDNAAAVLKKYTLSLDYGTLSPNLFGIVRQGMPRGSPAVLDYGFSIPLPDTGRPSESVKAEMKKVHTLARNAGSDENRLIVVFMPLSGYGSGFCVLEPECLPWVLVDPSRPLAPHSNTLVHEIGHACRLGHQQMDSGGDYTNSKEY